jgi:nucleotide-binding universal stress UspA family protein
MKTVLAPVDFSSVSNRVAEAAGELAAAFSARVVLLHVIAPPLNVVTYDMPVEAFSKELEFAQEQATRKLSALRRLLDIKGLKVETRIVQGHAVETILAEAEAEQAAYVVMGSHGHGALYELLAGSTTHGVLHRARCPVVILPRRKQ